MSTSSMPVAIVTGTNSGVGLALVVRLASTHKVYAGMRGVSVEKRATLDAAVNAANLSENVFVVELDVNNDESVSTAVSKVVEETGRCDILVNNAGFSVFGSVEMVSMDTMQSQLNTNVLGVVRCTKAVLPAMRKQKSGKIINVSSVGGVWGQPFNDIYCASKFALEGLAESQAPLFKQFGVYVSNVQPGSITSEFMNNANKPDPASIPAEYLPSIQSTMASYALAQKDASRSQTPDEVAAVIMEKVVNVEKPPLKVQTNPSIQAVFEMQNKDTSGEAGVAAATARFLSSGEQKKKAAITLHYWPIVGRSMGPTLMLEDSGVAYDRVNYMGGELPDPSVVAVPCIELEGGNFVSQTMAIMETLADELGYLTPTEQHNKALQCMYNIYDITAQSITKRINDIKTKSEAAEFVKSRVSQFFVAIEAGYEINPGVFYCGDKPTMVDFQLLSAVIALKTMFGEEVVEDMLTRTAPKVVTAASAVAARPNVKAFIDGKYKGMPLYSATMGVESSLLKEE